MMSQCTTVNEQNNGNRNNNSMYLYLFEEFCSCFMIENYVTFCLDEMLNYWFIECCLKYTNLLMQHNGWVFLNL